MQDFVNSHCTSHVFSRSFLLFPVLSSFSHVLHSIPEHIKMTGINGKDAVIPLPLESLLIIRPLCPSVFRISRLRLSILSSPYLFCYLDCVVMRDALAASTGRAVCPKATLGLSCVLPTASCLLNCANKLVVSAPQSDPSRCTKSKRRGPFLPSPH